jgi:acetyltransferase-like isoleucine patch superfamily enzyme
MNVVVLKGVRIGRGTVVAANSVVTRSLPAGVLAGGVPARVIRTLPSGEAQSGGLNALRAAIGGAR